MSLEGSEGALSTVYAEFMSSWEASAAYWQDAKRVEFEAEYVDELDALVRTGSSAMTELAALVRQVRRDCE